MVLGNAAEMLAGVRVIEFSSFVAVPSAGLVMRQLGAEVIRVDPLGGGPDFKRWPLTTTDESIYWAGLNRGKKSVCLDFHSDEHRQLIGELVAQPGDGAGVVLSNMRGREWLSDEALRQHRQDLIHVQVLGNADGSPAVDYTVNAATGMPMSTGPVGQGMPINHVLPAWDLMTGMYAAFAVVSALGARRTDGYGRYLTISLEDVALSTLTTLGFLGEAMATGAPRPRIGNDLYGSFGLQAELADSQSVMIVALTQRQWASLLDVTGTTQIIAAVERELAADFSDEGERYRHREILNALIRPWFRARTLTQVSEALSVSAVLWAPYRNFHDVASSLKEHPSAVVGEKHDDHLGSLLATSGPIRAADAPPPGFSAAPPLGSDTATVLQPKA